MENTLPSHKPIVVVGSANLDLVAVAAKIPAIGETVIGTDFQIHPGGKGANQAVAIARLGYPVQFIGRLGSDSFGAQLRMHLERAGVDIAGLVQSEGASGVALIVVSSKGENSIVVAPGANAKVTPDDIEEHLPMIREAGMVLAQLEIPLDTVEYLASVCANEKVPLMLDPAPANQLPAGVFRHVEWFTPNESEAAFYTAQGNGHAGSPAPAELAKALLARGCHGVVLKLGSRGAYLASQEAHEGSVPAFAVKAIDTTAAGDAFNGAFAVGLMLGKPPQASASFAAAVAAVSVTRVGAQPSMPTMAEVESFMSHHGAACS
jgi:ribokinase